MLALTTSNKVWLAVFAGVFIAFALVASFVLPRRDPDFPGERGRNWFIAVTIALFVAMMFAVSVFAQESEEEGEAGEAVTETAPGGEQTGAPLEGDPASGKALFASLGCGGCHAFEAAGSDASVGPNLDESLEGDDAAYVRESIVDPSAQVVRGFQPLMPDQYGDLSEEQLDDLIAFLLGGGGTETTPTETAPTVTAPTETAPTETGGEAEGGDPAAGKSVFAAQGCAACHTFSPAGSNATVGPNLDESLAGDDAASIHESIVEPSAQVVSGFQPIMPGDYGQKLSEKQLNDLIAFLQQ